MSVGRLPQWKKLQSTTTEASHLDMMEDYYLDPIECEEPDSQKLSVSWAMGNTAVAELMREVFGSGCSLECYEFEHDKYSVHLLFKHQEFIQVHLREGSLKLAAADLNEVESILEVFVSDVWEDHLRWVKDCKERQCKDAHQPVWTFRLLGFENYEKKTLLEGIFNKGSSDFESYFRVRMNSNITLGGFRMKIMKAHDFVQSLALEDGGTGFWLNKMDGTDFSNDDDDVKIVNLVPFKAIVV